MFRLLWLYHCLLEALERNARASARLTDCGPAERRLRAAVARSKTASNGHGLAHVDRRSDD